ncbi:MAG: HAD-IIB family hydrolase [Treponema sp.]|jgi:HAD superfamily hydrolase (TIGR01484 family)|nr:HAD-IIB family hydrolase [Treponema sp.]
MKPIREMSPAEAAGIRCVLMDIDDTLTREGKLLASAYTSLWKLKEAGLRVIPVTGRPAGWCDLIAREWPVDGVVGENGALAFWEERAENGGGSPVLKAGYHPQAIRNDHPVLAKIRDRALGEFPQLRIAKDQFSRLYDLALDFAEEEPILPLSVARRVRDLAVEEGAQAKVSSIHVNIWMGNYDKLSMAERFLSQRFGWRCGAGDGEVVFVGDSPNDEPMFARFPLACGVANVRKYGDLLQNLPAYVSTLDCGDGFAEIAETILAKRKEAPGGGT